MRESSEIRTRFAQIIFWVVAGISFSTAKIQGDPASPNWKTSPGESFIDKIPPPPSPDSEEGKKDVAEVIKLQAAATPEQVARAKWTLNLQVFTFNEALGNDKNFTAAKYPQTDRFFSEVNDLIQRKNDVLKNHFKRPHPFEVDPVHIRQIVVAPAVYGYPSFHTERCVVFVNILSFLDPPVKDTFLRVARQVELDRVLAGEHFPSDIRAGKIIGTLIYEELEKDQDFQAALLELKTAEWTPPPKISVNIPIYVP